MTTLNEIDTLLGFEDVLRGIEQATPSQSGEDLPTDLDEAAPTTRECHEDRAEESLFGSILGAHELPPFPEHLVQFDRELKRREAAKEAEAVFVMLLRRRWGLPAERLFADQADALPCSDPAVTDAFSPDYPTAGDYVGGEDAIAYKDDITRARANQIDWAPLPADYDGAENSFAYQRQERIADIQRATARRVCETECPVRLLCLARSLKADSDAHSGPMVNFEQPADVQGGWGGWPRQRIAEKLHSMRRDFEAGRMDPEVRESFERRARRDGSIT